MPGDSPFSRPPPRRILVRGVNWLGDAVITTPALLRLRERFPDAHITLLTPAKLRDLWLHHPTVNEIVTFEAGEGLLSVSRKLRAGEFDRALVLPNSLRSALEVWLARIPQRVGGARPWRNVFLTHAVPPRTGALEMRKRSVAEIQKLVGESRTQPATRNPQSDGSLPPPASAHHLHQYLHLVAALGADPTPLAPQLVVTPAEVEAVATKFGLPNLADGSPVLLGLNPGAEYGPAKRWPASRFVEAAARVQRHPGCRWLVFGGPAETTLAEKVAADIRCGAEAPPTLGKQSPVPPAVSLAGRTSLRELMALLKLCRVLLTNDTGPMHVAAAVGTPVVVPFGSTSLELTGPGLPGDPRHALLKSDAPCAPCFLRECPIDFRCMNGISVERVAAAVVESLNRERLNR
jgi:heptosyltransferase-2